MSYLWLTIAVFVLVIANAVTYAYAWYAHKRIDILSKSKFLVMDKGKNMNADTVMFKVDKDTNSVTVSQVPAFLKDKIDGVE